MLTASFFKHILIVFRFSFFVVLSKSYIFYLVSFLPTLNQTPRGVSKRRRGEFLKGLPKDATISLRTDGSMILLLLFRIYYTRIRFLRNYLDSENQIPRLLA